MSPELSIDDPRSLRQLLDEVSIEKIGLVLNEQVRPTHKIWVEPRAKPGYAKLILERTSVFDDEEWIEGTSVVSNCCCIYLGRYVFDPRRFRGFERRGSGYAERAEFHRVVPNRRIRFSGMESPVARAKKGYRLEWSPVKVDGVPLYEMTLRHFAEVLTTIVVPGLEARPLPECGESAGHAMIRQVLTPDDIAKWIGNA